MFSTCGFELPPRAYRRRCAALAILFAATRSPAFADKFVCPCPQITLQHLERLTANGVCYRSFSELYLDSCGVLKDAVIGILAFIAKQERVRLSERTRVGLAIAKSKGRFAGRPRLNVQRSEIARLRASGLSLRAIGRQLQISEGSVRRLVSIAA